MLKDCPHCGSPIQSEQSENGYWYYHCTNPNCDMESSFKPDASQGESDLLFNRRTADYSDIYDDVIKITKDVESIKKEVSARLGGSRGLFDRIEKDLNTLKGKMSDEHQSDIHD